MPTFLPARRIAAGVAVTAALAGGGAALAAPAHAQPRNPCVSLRTTYDMWMDQWQWDIDNQSGQAAYDRDADHALAALDRLGAAGCL